MNVDLDRYSIYGLDYRAEVVCRPCDKKVLYTGVKPRSFIEAMREHESAFHDKVN